MSRSAAITMAEVWVIFGATGTQGGAVVRDLLQDVILAKAVSVRAAVRDPSKPTAIALCDVGCELVRADLDDKKSLKGALEGASGVFLVTANDKGEGYYDRELQQGKDLADAAVEAGVQKIIFSTLPSVRNITQDQLTKVVHFDVKYDIEQYIRQLPMASCFVALGAFMQNISTVLRPRPDGTGAFAIKTSMPGSTLLPWVDATDVGPVVTQIVKDLDKFRGRTIYVASQLKTLDEMADIIGKANARRVRYVQIPPEEFLAPLPGPVAEDWEEFAPFMSEYGYFGPDTKTLRLGGFGQLTTLEDFVSENVKLVE